MRKIKGQVTLFVIIALMVVILIGFLIFFLNKNNSKPFEPSDITVSSKFEPVQNYVTQCVNQIATEGIIKLGLHGGYIDPTDPVLSNVYFESNILQQYNSDLVYLDQNDKNSGVAYWFEVK